MAFQFYINGQLTNQPDNDMALITTIRRDDDLGGIFTTQDVTLQYSASNNVPTGTISGYALLKAMFDDGTCNEADIEIYDPVSTTQTYRLYTGVLKVPSMIVELGQVSISTKVEDNNYYAYIKNNQNIPFNLYATKSKNGTFITPPQIYEGDMFYGQTGVFLSTIGNLYRGYRIFDVLAYLVSAISDNKVSFQSDYLTQPDIQLFLYDGFALSHANTDPNIIVTFNQLIQELFKLKNIFFYIDQTDPDAPILRLEDQAWFYLGSTVMTFTEPQNVRVSVDPRKLYGTVKVGSSYNPGGTAGVYTSPAAQSYYGWKEEIYTPNGQCNTDAVSDLINEFSISNNSVNYQVSGAVNENEDMKFIIEMQNVDTTLFTATAVDYEIFGNGIKRFYNVGLNNVNKIAAHDGNFQSAVTNTQTVSGDIFKAELGGDIVLIDINVTGSPYSVDPIIFVDEFGSGNYDPNGNYDNVLGYYTAPVDGDYSFKVNLRVQVENTLYCSYTQGQPQPPTIRDINLSTGSQVFTDTAWGLEMIMNIIAYEDNTFTTVIATSTKTYRTYIDGTTTITQGLTVTLPTNAVVLVTTTSRSLQFAPLFFGNTPLDEVQPIPYIIYANCSYGGGPNRVLYALETSTFECNGTPDGGLELSPNSPELYKSKIYEFDYPLTATEIRAIKLLPTGAMELIKDGQSIIGWVDELQINDWTGLSQIKIRTQDATV